VLASAAVAAVPTVAAVMTWVTPGGVPAGPAPVRSGHVRSGQGGRGR